MKKTIDLKVEVYFTPDNKPTCSFDVWLKKVGKDNIPSGPFEWVDLTEV